MPRYAFALKRVFRKSKCDTLILLREAMFHRFRLKIPRLVAAPLIR